jgi:hypothetical protein
MLDFCLYVFHWSVPSQYVVTLALLIAIVLTVRVAWSMAKGKFGREKVSIPRVQSVCENLRRQRAANAPDESAIQPTDELSEYASPLRR